MKFSNSTLYTFGEEECSALAEHFSRTNHGLPPSYWSDAYAPFGKYSPTKNVFIDVSVPRLIGQQCSPVALAYVMLRSLNLLPTLCGDTWADFSLHVWVEGDWTKVTPESVLATYHTQADFSRAVQSIHTKFKNAGAGFQHYVGLSLLLQGAAISEAWLGTPLNLVLVNPTAYLHPDSKQHMCEVVSSQLRNIFKQKLTQHECLHSLGALSLFPALYETMNAATL